MVNTNRIAEIGAAVGEPARAAMLLALMDGRALTAAELARVAGVTPQTASSHLARLAAGGLLAVEKQGRHRYHRLATQDVARVLEGLMQIACAEPPPAGRALVVGPRDRDMRLARTCYDHLAGRLGVGIADAMLARGLIQFEGDGGQLTAEGEDALSDLGIVLPDPAPGRRRSARPVCRPCLDWSERRPHVAGRLGAAMCGFLLDQAWVRRREGTRALEITPKGIMMLRETFGFTIEC